MKEHRELAVCLSVCLSVFVCLSTCVSLPACLPASLSEPLSVMSNQRDAFGWGVVGGGKGCHVSLRGGPAQWTEWTGNRSQSGSHFGYKRLRAA